MKASELRIGNLVLKSLKSGNGREIEGEIGHADLGRIFEGSGSFNYRPIPLTEKWLLKFGFPWEIKFQANGNDEFWGLFSECYPKQKGYKLIMKRDKFLLVPELKYVHQLQNLFFALTGEELEINS